MPAYKITFFFESQQQGLVGTGASLGWTETWYWQNNLTIEETINHAEIGRYLENRAPILGTKYRMSFVRVSDDNVPRRFKVAGVNQNGSASADASCGDAQVQCAVLVNMERLPALDQPGEKVHARSFLLRGLPSNLIDGNVINATSVNFPNLTRFLNFIANKPARGGRGVGQPARSELGIKYLSPAVVKAFITSLTARVQTLGKTIELVTDPPLVLAQGDKVIVQGVDSPLGVEKVWTKIRTVNLEPLTHELGTSRRQLQGSYAAPGTGRAFKPLYLYGQIDQYAIIGLRNRKTGRVFRQLRGRSSAR